MLKRCCNNNNNNNPSRSCPVPPGAGRHEALDTWQRRASESRSQMLGWIQIPAPPRTDEVTLESVSFQFPPVCLPYFDTGPSEGLSAAPRHRAGAQDTSFAYGFVANIILKPELPLPFTQPLLSLVAWPDFSSSASPASPPRALSPLDPLMPVPPQASLRGNCYFYHLPGQVAESYGIWGQKMSILIMSP